MSAMPKRSIEDFISYWSAADQSERQISQTFLLELCELLEVPSPKDEPIIPGYTFEFPISEILPDGTTTPRSIDLYKRTCFVLESKKFQIVKTEQTKLDFAAEQMRPMAKRKKSAAPKRDTDRWDVAMLKAHVQARDYADALPDNDEPRPPFLLVVDVGHVIEVYADFSQAGRSYQQFPDSLNYRIRLNQLSDPEIRERLKLIWTNPFELDPSKRSAEVTKDVAGHLATLATSFEEQGHTPQVVAEFLTRCLFCMFAEDVHLLNDADGKKGFTELLKKIPANGDGFETLLRALFKEMNEGRNKGNEISVILRRKLLQFNGGLFADDTVLPVNAAQLEILRAAAALDWKHVEPAIFGTLLERALGGEGERHKLGAHFTPRAYVERLVLPTIVEPLRVEWEKIKGAAVLLGTRGDIEGACKAINQFHDRLCNVKVLDPACGSGNFLYVALENLKRLEGEILDFANQFGESFKLEIEKVTVDPHQFLGLEINPRAVSLAELVLWIGYLQWHFRTRGQTPPREPVLKKFNNIQHRDAVLAYDGEPQPVRDGNGNEIKVWDRSSKKKDSVTGRDVPDESKRVTLLTYTNPRPATWPDADYIVGNPPFLGARTIRPALDDGYLDALRGAYPNIPENADFVMYWWHKAAELVRAGKVKRFGLITTNSLRQSFNRQVTETQLAAQPPLSLAFAIPDHPWVDTADGAAVRIAMTVGVSGKHAGELWEIKDEQPQGDGSAKVSFQESHGKILPDIRIGAELTTAKVLKANYPFCCVGYQLTGTGFVLTPEGKNDLATKDKISDGQIFHPLLSARDITQETRGLWAIDLFGHTLESIRKNFPQTYQQVLTLVKPERDANARASVRDRWWIYGEARSTFRPALADLKRVIVAPLTSKHRLFVFCEKGTIADSTTVLFALDDAFHLGVLSSRIHVVFSLAAGGRLGVGNDPRYNKSDCFDPFPFPLCDEAEREQIREKAEDLDARRKLAQAQHGLTLTGIYNVLEKLRAGEPLTAKEKLIHDNGLVSNLKQLHDELDAAVFAAYGWPANMTDAEILERLVKLNTERAAEEVRGVIHWLRPEYQAKGQQEIKLEAKPAKKTKTKPATPAKRMGKLAWPGGMAERVQTVETALHAAGAAVAPEDLAKQFARAKPKDVAEILKTLETLGRARSAGEGKFRP